jgi:hypothetical protein
VADAKDALRAAPIGTRSVERFLRRFYNLAGMTVTDHVRGDLSPSVEMRPVQGHELRDFGLVPWSVLVGPAAVVAEFGVAEVRPLLNPAMDLVITRVEVTGLPCFYGLLAPTAALAATSVRVTDTGILEAGQSLSSAAHVATGSAVAVPGGLFGVLAVAVPLSVEPPSAIAILRQGSTSSFQVWGAAANTAFNVTLSGYAVPVNMSTV